MKFSNKVHDYFREDAIRGMDQNFMDGSIFVVPERAQVFRIKVQFTKPLDRVYGVYLGILAR